MRGVGRVVEDDAARVRVDGNSRQNISKCAVLIIQRGLCCQVLPNVEPVDRVVNVNTYLA